MKTRSEKKFDDLVISMIMNSEISNEAKTERLKLFFKDHSFYYENLCYNVYYLSLLPGTNVLTIDDFGVSYVNLKEAIPERKYYEILVLNDLTPASSDIIMHIDTALNQLYELVHAKKTH